MADFRQHIPTKDEIVDIAIAVIALSIAFALALGGGITGGSQFLSVLPIAFFAILFSFPLHEYMHKIVAQRFGAIAAFKRSDYGIVLTLIAGLVGFLFGLPGATVIYASNFTDRENGLVSIAGPLTNFVLFAVFFGISLLPQVSTSAFLSSVVSFVLFINLWLAFFNMLPLYPLDGSKVLKWSKPAYAGTMAIIIVMLFLINPSIDLIFSMVIAFVFATVMSFAYRGMRLF